MAENSASLVRRLVSAGFASVVAGPFRPRVADSFAVNRQQITGGYQRFRRQYQLQAPAPPTAGSSSWKFPGASDQADVIAGTTLLEDPFQTLVASEVPNSRHGAYLQCASVEVGTGRGCAVQRNVGDHQIVRPGGGLGMAVLRQRYCPGKKQMGQITLGTNWEFTGLDNQDMMFTGWTVGFVVNR